MTISVMFNPSWVISFQTANALDKAKGRNGTRIPAGGLSQESSNQDFSVELLFKATGGCDFSRVLCSVKSWVSAEISFFYLS